VEKFAKSTLNYLTLIFAQCQAAPNIKKLRTFSIDQP